MRAAVVEEPNKLVVRDVPEPVTGPHDVLCEILFGATCTGTDQHLIAGRFPFGMRFPTVLGHESIGRAVRLGAKVRNIKVGDLISRVGYRPPEGSGLSVNWGGFAEYGVARDHWAARADGRPPAEWHGYRVNQVLPVGSDPAQSTMIITWRETLSYITRMGVASAGSVLVLGTGGNGLSFVNHAKNLGVGFVAAVGAPARENLARAVGADAFFGYHVEPLDTVIRERRADGFDFIIDAVGKKGQIDRVSPLLKPGGTLGIYGVDDYGNCPINPHRIRGVWTFYNGGYDEEEAHQLVVDGIRAGTLQATPYLGLDSVFDLSEIGDAIAAVATRTMVKAVVRIRG